MATLFALLEPNDALRESLIPVLSRRVRYLERRAQNVSERREGEARSTAWTVPMATASLWLEAAEGAVALGELEEAKRHLRWAVERFLQLQLPFGAVLQRGLAINGDGLHAQADKVLMAWQGRLEESKEGEARHSFDAGADLRADESPHQWAYFALANALASAEDTDGAMSFGEDHPNLDKWRMVPMGRMRLPLNFYQFVAQMCRSARRPGGLLTATEEDQIAEVIGKALTGLFRAAQWARANDYLWARLLAPVPLFDFDTASLIACVLQTPGKLGGTLEQRLEGFVPAEASPYAREFVETVRALRSRPRPSGLARAM